MALVDVLRANGFLIATDAPYNAVGNGVADDWAALQALANDGIVRRRPVYLPGNKTYKISKTLRLDTFQHRTANPSDYHHRWFGGIEGGVRPKIVLAANAAGFGSHLNPKPTVYVNNWRPDKQYPQQNPRPPNLDSQNPYTTNPTMTYNGVTYTWEPWAANLYYNVWYNIDIDTGQNPGADGMAFLCAQANLMGSSKIVATGSNIGLRAGSGRACPCVNVEVIGGRYAASIVHPRLDQSASMVYIGFKASGQTVAVFEQYGEFGPHQIIGFDITTNNIPVFETTTQHPNPSGNVFLMHDGVVREIGGSNSTPFRNPTGRTCYLRNVWVTGTNNLIQHPGGTVTGTGTWKRVAEYTQNDMQYAGLDNVEVGRIASLNMVNGVVSRTAQAVPPSIENNAAAPADMVAVHWPGMAYFTDNMIDVTSAPYNADRTGATDSIAAFEAAMLAAESAGHNVVFVPPGRYTISRALNLRKDTKLIGGGDSDVDYNLPYVGTRIMPSANWIPGNITDPIVTTPNDAAATCQILFLCILKPSNVGSNAGKYTFYHNNLLWRSGRHSRTLCVNLYKVWEPEALPGQQLAQHINLDITGNGGGRHYGYAAANGDQYSGKLTRGLRVRGTTEPLFVYSCQYEITKSGVAADTNIEIDGCQNVRLYGFKREGFSPTVMINNSQNVAAYGHAAGRNNLVRPGYFWVKGSSNNILYAGHVITRNERAPFECTYSQSGTVITVSLPSHGIPAGNSVSLKFTSGTALSGRYVIQSVSPNSFTVTASDSKTTSGNALMYGKWDTLTEEITGLGLNQIDFPHNVGYYRRGTIDDAAMAIPTPAEPPPFQSASLSKAIASPSDTVDFTLAPTNQAPNAVTLAAVSASLSNQSVSGGRITMPNKAALLTGAFKSVKWFTPQPVVISFASAAQVSAQLAINGPVPANAPGASNFWGTRPVVAEE